MSTWYRAKNLKPKLTPEQRKPNQFGVQVLIWPPYRQLGASDVHIVFYGTRQTDKPEFYIYGRCIDVEYWRHLPKPPASSLQNLSEPT